MNSNPHKEKLVKTIQKLAHRHSTWSLFSDFVELIALTIANSITLDNNVEWQKREDRYLQIINKYNPDEQQVFPEMFADLEEALQYELTQKNAPVDVLGPVFHELKLHNTYKAQFFSPQHICDMMGAIALGDSREELEKQGYISLSEPTCGSGAMVLGFARAMAEANLNYCSQLFAIATDIDPKCAHMTYIQLSLYGIPAVVIHGNSLTLEEWSKWYTPIYVTHGWRWKIRRTMADTREL